MLRASMASDQSPPTDDPEVTRAATSWDCTSVPSRRCWPAARWTETGGILPSCRPSGWRPGGAGPVVWSTTATSTSGCSSGWARCRRRDRAEHRGLRPADQTSRRPSAWTSRSACSPRTSGVGSSARARTSSCWARDHHASVRGWPTRSRPPSRSRCCTSPTWRPPPASSRDATTAGPTGTWVATSDGFFAERLARHALHRDHAGAGAPRRAEPPLCATRGSMAASWTPPDAGNRGAHRGVVGRGCVGGRLGCTEILLARSQQAAHVPSGLATPGICTPLHVNAALDRALAKIGRVLRWLPQLAT